MSKPAIPPGPLDRAPRGIRPPFTVYEPVDHQRADETLDQWGARSLDDRVAALEEALDGVELGVYDRTILRWLAIWDTDTIGTIASLFHRARAAGGGR